jgi:hypothetical protein
MRIVTMKLEIFPLRALCDERISIKVSDLPPSADVTMGASLVFPRAKNVRYESSAVFRADANGYLDLSTQKPVSGSYDIADSVGLIQPLRRVRGKFKDAFENISVNSLNSSSLENINCSSNELFRSQSLRT